MCSQNSFNECIWSRWKLVRLIHGFHLLSASQLKTHTSWIQSNTCKSIPLPSIYIGTDGTQLCHHNVKLPLAKNNIAHVFTRHLESLGWLVESHIERYNCSSWWTQYCKFWFLGPVLGLWASFAIHVHEQQVVVEFLLSLLTSHYWFWTGIQAR